MNFRIVELREDRVTITGYVNAIERYSKPITERLHGKIRTFLERVKAGVFTDALKRNNSVKVLLNHDKRRELANTSDGTAKLIEDNIGLRAEVIITDKDVVEKARKGKLIGWSFGFYPNDDVLGREGNYESRTITSLDLDEVSILDDTKAPAYYGTSLEARSIENRTLEYRSLTEEIEETSNDEQTKEENIKIENLAELIAKKVVEELKGTGIEETTPNPVEEEDGEERAIDYSTFESRIANLK